jgi:ferredoxin
MSTAAPRFVELAQLLACVHCGLCQSACPTYLELGAEADSPRGRIQGSEGRKVRMGQYVRAVDAALRDLLGGRETPLIMAATFGMSRSFRSRQAVPMQNRCAPPARAARAASITASGSIRRVALRPVSKLEDWLQ